MKTFSNIQPGELIARVEGYKVECAKVVSKERITKDEFKFVVKGIETKKKCTFNVRGKNYTMVGFNNDQDVPERYYSDGSIVESLRDGIEIGIRAARQQITESFKPMNPFFTVNGKLIDDNK